MSSVYDLDIVRAVTILKQRGRTEDIDRALLLHGKPLSRNECEEIAENHRAWLNSIGDNAMDFLNRLLTIRGSAFKHAVAMIWRWDAMGGLLDGDIHYLARHYPRVSSIFSATGAANANRNLAAMDMVMKSDATRAALKAALMWVGYSEGKAAIRAEKARDEPTTRKARAEAREAKRISKVNK